MTKFKIGDKVGYSIKFLRSIREKPTSEFCHAKGKILELKNYGKNCEIATIKWDNPNIPENVNCFNLAKVGPNLEYCAC